MSTSRVNPTATEHTTLAYNTYRTSLIPAYLHNTKKKGKGRRSFCRKKLTTSSFQLLIAWSTTYMPAAYINKLLVLLLLICPLSIWHPWVSMEEPKMSRGNKFLVLPYTVYLFLQDTGPIGLSSIHMASTSPNYFCKDLISKWGHKHKYLETGLQSLFLGFLIQLIPSPSPPLQATIMPSFRGYLTEIEARKHNSFLQSKVQLEKKLPKSTPGIAQVSNCRKDC